MYDPEIDDGLSLRQRVEQDFCEHLEGHYTGFDLDPLFFKSVTVEYVDKGGNLFDAVVYVIDTGGRKYTLTRLGSDEINMMLHADNVSYTEKPVFRVRARTGKRW